MRTVGRFLARTMLLCILCGAVTGCATIINGTTQSIAITSTPNGAKVIVDESDTSYTTPANVELSRNHDHVLTFNLASYQQETFTIKHSLSGVVAGNILAGGLIGWGVDAADGAQDKLTPETVQMTLNPIKPAVEEDLGSVGGLTGGLGKLDTMYSQKVISKDEYDAARKRLIDETVAPPHQTVVTPSSEYSRRRSKPKSAETLAIEPEVILL